MKWIEWPRVSAVVVVATMLLYALVVSVAQAASPLRPVKPRVEGAVSPLGVDAEHPEGARDRGPRQGGNGLGELL